MNRSSKRLTVADLWDRPTINRKERRASLKIQKAKKWGIYANRRTNSAARNDNHPSENSFIPIPKGYGDTESAATAAGDSDSTRKES